MVDIRFLRTFWALAGLALAAGSCDGPPPPGPLALRSDPRVEVCSGGASVSLGAEATSNLSKVLSGEAAITTKVERRVESILGTALASKLTGAEILEFQKNYLQCLRDESVRETAAARASWDAPDKAQCQAAQSCEDAVMARVTSCRETVQDMGLPMARENAAVRDCFKITQKIAGCYRATDETLDLARARCEQV